MINVDEIYGLVGGDAPFYELVERFYENVEAAPALRSHYPVDLEPGKKHLAWFLIQRFGGPNLFNMNRGAPMLRRRHMPFKIDVQARDLWMECMMSAVDRVPSLAVYRESLDHFFDHAATFLINSSETPPAGQMLSQV